jgi:hypothetical protein
MHKGRLRITKRGSSMARKYLYLLSWRLVQSDPIIARWYRSKVARDGGFGSKALIAVMRKMAKALWHVRQGNVFDSSKLFDVRHLDLVAA